MERGQRIRCEHQDDGAGSQCIIWAQLSMANPPRWARWLYAALAGLVVARVATHLAAPALPAPLGARLNAAVTRALPVATYMLLLPLGIGNTTSILRAHSRLVSSWGWRLFLLGGLLFLPAGAYSACVQLEPSLASGGGYGSALAAAFVALASGVLGLPGSIVIGWETLLDTIRDLAQQGRDGREL
ncbi:MAG TPA: hypothetical protein VGS80_27020 [Ktedonobacterales bacterium]|nr:hypothetical protein [Ktedonobacterales bacterium]